MSKTHYVIPVFVPDWGCPHQCVFCNQKKITGQAEVPTAEQVASKITEYLQTIPDKPGITKEVAFYGGSFTAVDPELQRELLKAAYKFVLKGEVDSIRISTRPDAISENILALLVSYGVKTVELGVQSMNDEILQQAGRGHTSGDVLRSATMIKSWGVELGVQIIVGLPGDSLAGEIRTAFELVELEPDFVRIYPCIVLKGTSLEQLYLSKAYKPLTLDEAVLHCQKLFQVFDHSGINVIRIGLQPSEQISLEGEVIGGPFHPAFRELVMSAVARDQIEYLLKDRADVRFAKTLEFAVSEQDISIVRGHHAGNVAYFKQKFGVEKFITIPEQGLARGVIRLTGIDGGKCNYQVSRNELPLMN